MKELDINAKLKDKQQVEQSIEIQESIELKFIGSVSPKSKSHTLWEIDTKTLKVTKAEFMETSTLTWEECLNIYKGTFKEEIVIRPNYVYISSLNQKTALKRYKEGKGSAIKARPKLNLKDLV